MRLGVIADDFTGATDIAGFLVNGGMSVIQLNGIPDSLPPEVNKTDAVVISLKSRSWPVDEAITLSLAALACLRELGCEQFYFKYCSTFDSTEKGNIGPVTDAILVALGLSFTVLAPGLPVNGRFVFQGHLFVGTELLSDSGMRNHPITPMRDSFLPRVMESQSSGLCGVVPHALMTKGHDAVKNELTRLKCEGYRYAVLDAADDSDLTVAAKAVADMPFITGSSGLAGRLAAIHYGSMKNMLPARCGLAADEDGLKTVILAGSCSRMTLIQVAEYQHHAPSVALDMDLCFAGGHGTEEYLDNLAQWASEQANRGQTPMIASSASVDALTQYQTRYGRQASGERIEQCFAELSLRLAALGFNRFIVAGGETSGVVTQSLGVTGFYIGPTIVAGVPWVKAINKPIYLALKSGNFGESDFFTRAQEMFSYEFSF